MKKRYVFALIIVLWLGYVVPLPYYVTEPGSVEDLHPLVQVDDGHEIDGSYSLVTIHMRGANVYRLVHAAFSPHTHSYPKQAIAGDKSDEEYHAEQLENMMMAKNGAIIAAFKKADRSIEIEYDGVIVREVMKDSPAEAAGLLASDQIRKVDGDVLDTEGKLVSILADKAVGDLIALEIIRGDETLEKSVELMEIADGKPGIGVHFIENQHAKSDPDVKIDSEKIAGPSAGLLFALEIYDQLNEESYAKGRKIAGTGAISSDGTVGAVGGVDQKVVAAHHAACDIFFVPAGENYETAAKAAKKIKTEMTIVPVETFDEAVDYLH